MTHTPGTSQSTSSPNSWVHDTQRRHLVVDIIYALIAALMVVVITSSSVNLSQPALLFNTTGRDVLLYSLLTAALLAIRRTLPELAAWLFLALTVVHLFIGPALSYGDLLASFFLYSAIEYGKPRSTKLFIVAAAVMTLVSSTVWGLAFTLGPLFGEGRSMWQAWLHSSGTAECSNTYIWGANTACTTGIMQHTLVFFAGIAATMFAAIVMALWQRARQSTIQAMQERNDALAASEAEERAIAASAERARISRDMHDVVAHTLSTIIVQADGGRYAGSNDINVARTTMQTIRTEATQAQSDMNQLFSTFGQDARANYANISTLVSDSAMPTTRRITGKAQPERLSSAADEAVYRLVQEALSNARKYAGDGASVTVNEIWTSDMLSLTVSDNGQGEASTADGHSPGYGLVGMKERMTAIGGSVEAHAKPDGGFLVAASVPLESVAQTTAAVSPVQITKPATDGESVKQSWITRLAHWSEQHYLLVDIMQAVLLALLFGTLFFYTYAPLPPTLNTNAIISIVISVGILIAFALRRRFPETTTACVAVLCALQLLFCPFIFLPADILVLVMIYSAVLYGHERAWRWVLVAIMVDALLFGAKITHNGFRNGTIADVLQWKPETYGQGVGLLIGAAIYGLFVGVACLGFLGLAKWRRSRGNNALVLMQRNEALQLEQEKQKVMAANLERERISAAMQSEVSATLGTVITQTDDGLAMLKNNPSSEEIASAFTSIAHEGRVALAHMRSLLTTLRETGFSDDSAQQQMALSPNASIGEQMQGLASNQSHTNTNGTLR